MTITAKRVTLMAGVDVVLLAAACLVPAASHVLAFPLYKLNPMLALLLAGMLFSAKCSALSAKPTAHHSIQWANALVLALLMPLVSCLVVGMPVAPKMLCMMAELATVAGLFHLLSWKWNAIASVFVAILAGKVVYYALKALVLAPATLVGTEWWMQLGTVVVWGGLFAMLYNKTIRK